MIERAGARWSTSSPVPGLLTAGDELVDLRDPAADDPARTGAKAAALAVAGRHGLPTLPGVVLTTGFAAGIDAGARVAGHPVVAEALRRLGLAPGARAIARSSSPLEDTITSSMAGQFDSVAGLVGIDELERGVQAVLDSRTRAAAPGAPMAVLLQPEVEPVFGGVAFGIDPVSGRSDRRVVAAVRGSVEPLVSGAVSGARYGLDPRGRVVERSPGDDGLRLRRRDLRAVLALSELAADVFGGPQDIEWAMLPGRELVLLQSRPITTEAKGAPIGPVYGPGPVAETFPEPLTELEHDLWVPPLREAVTAAVRLAGTATAAEVEASEVVVTVQGHVAIDLRLAGDLPRPRSWWRRIDPRPALHRLRGAWRVGRLRSAVPDLADHLIDRTDADLREVPALAELSDRQLLALLHRSRDVLRALHAHEILMGLLVEAQTTRMTGASIALRVLVESRGEGLDDATIIEHSPVVLALSAPRIASGTELPPTASATSLGPAPDGGSDAALLREALRLRARWVQELAGRTAWELGARLAHNGDLLEAEHVRHLTLDHLDAIVTHRAVVVPALLQAHRHDFGSPLPSRFRLTDTGQRITVACAQEAGSGTGAGGGIARGPVTHDAQDPPPGSVLVTTTLSPGLGPRLVHLVGLVAETGSVLSHLAILAREAHVPTVVGYDGAVAALPEGTIVTVDGTTGQVTVETEGVEP